MDFAAVMLFTQQVFHLECLLLFRIKSQPGVAYKSVVYKKAFKVVFKSSKNEKLTLPHECLFLCLSGISLGRYCRKSLAKSGFGKNIKRGDGHKGGRGCL